MEASFLNDLACADAFLAATPIRRTSSSSNIESYVNEDDKQVDFNDS
jgi:hypothetical protein